MSPTARTLAKLRQSGWVAEVVEKTIPRINIKKDLFNCIDIIAIRENRPVLAIQATTMDHRMERVRKSESLDSTKVWLSTGSRFQVWCWRRLKSGWTLHRTDFYLQDGNIGYGEFNEA